jgi:transcriptional regulator of acetoin/glycerol metabolism
MAKIDFERTLLKTRTKLGIRTLQEVKCDAMDAAYVATKGDVILAAFLLGIGKTSLYRHFNTRGFPKLKGR